MSDQYYAANVDAKLFRGVSRTDPLPAFLSDTYVEVPLTGSIKGPANTLSTKTFNVTNDGDKRSLAGTKGDKVCSGNVVIDWSESVHVAMHDDSDVSGGVKSNWYLLYPTGRRKYFKGTLTKWDEQPFDAGDEAVEHRSDWEIAIDGAIQVVA